MKSCFGARWTDGCSWGRALTISTALIAFAAPTLASDARLNGMAEAVVASEWADPITLDDDLFRPIGFDHPGVQSDVLLDSTYLSQVLSVFGGTAHSEEIFDGMAITWACYETGNGRTTFVSLAMGAGDDTVEPAIQPGPLVDMIVEEVHAPLSAACSENPAAAAPLPGNDIPRLGATRIDLFNRFGGHMPEQDAPLAYVAHAELGDEESWTQTKTIYYRVENGLVTGVAYKLTTER